MFKYSLLALGVLMSGAPALAQAAPLDVELEGTIDSYVGATRTLSVMGMDVYVAPSATIHSPVTTQPDSGVSVTKWFRGETLPGRKRVGMIGGTAIVIGEWDPAAGRIVASDVFTEPSENVTLGVVTDSWCSNANCDGSVDFIRANSRVGGGPGPAMLPIRDPRLAANPVRDETGFALDLTGVNLNGLGFAAEGYYGDTPVTVQTGSTGSTVAEKAFHYFIFDLVNPAPQLFRNKNSREISALRTRCDVGDRFEARGHVHTTVNADGIDNDTINSTSGVIAVQFVNATTGQQIVQTGTATAVPGAAAVAQFRIRFDTPFCPETYTIRWLPNANASNNQAYATLSGIGLDRVR